MDEGNVRLHEILIYLPFAYLHIPAYRIEGDKESNGAGCFPIEWQIHEASLHP